MNAHELAHEAALMALADSDLPLVPTGECQRLGLPCPCCGSRETRTEVYFDAADNVVIGSTMCDACGAC